MSIALLARAAPYALSLGRGAWWLVKQPFTNTIRTGVVVGGAHYASDGATTRAALGAGEVLASGLGAVTGKENVESAGRVALDGAGKVVLGLAGAGNTVVQRYGPDVVSEVVDVLPTGRLGAVSTAVREGIAQVRPDLVTQGGIAVPDAARPSSSFREKAEDAIDSTGDLLGGLASKAELAQWGNLAKQDAAHNRFIQAGLLFGGISGAMGGNGAAGKTLHAGKNALLMAILFGAVGYMFGQRSSLMDAIVPKLTNAFNAQNNGPQDRVVAAPAPAPRRPVVALNAPEPSFS